MPANAGIQKMALQYVVEKPGFRRSPE